MIIIAGLGNPDDEYKDTRHNIGYVVVIELCKKLGIDFLKQANTYRANMYLKTDQSDTELVFCLPLGYMNNSGQAIRQVLDFYGDNTSKDLWVIHDDTEIPFGEVRVKFAGSSAGHNGVKSIDDTVGNKYWRIRIGVGRPKHPGYDLADYVLAPFSPDEKKQVPRVVDRVISYLIKSIQDQIESVTFNAKEKTSK